MDLAKIKEQIHFTMTPFLKKDVLVCLS